MRKILFILLISLVNLVYGQDIKPIDPINFKNLQSPSFSFYTLDSSVWIYKGSALQWTKLATANQYLRKWNDSIDFIKFTQAPALDSHQPYIIFADTANHSLSYYNDEQDITMQIGFENWTRVYNESGSTILNGQIVRADASYGGYPSVELADNRFHYTASNVLGVATHDIPDGTYGYITTAGEVRDLASNGSSSGDILYLGQNGMPTSIRPIHPNYVVQIGQCLFADPTSGKMLVKLIGKVDDIMLNMLNNTFVEGFEFIVSSNGTNVIGTLQRKGGGGDLTMYFDGGFTTLDCTPALQIPLTPGTSTVPLRNRVYILESDKQVHVSTSGWPAESHLRIADVILRTAAQTQTEGALKNQNWNDHTAEIDGTGHIAHLNARVRRIPADWYSGVEPSVVIQSAANPDNVYFNTTAGKVYQMHLQDFPAQTMPIDDVHIVNHPTSPYLTTNNLNTILIDATNATLSNRSFSLVFWGVQNETSEKSHIMVNLPRGSYNSGTDAMNDALNYSVYNIPREFLGTGFLIARVTFSHNPSSSGTWVMDQLQDLRGYVPNTTAGGGASGTGGGVTTFLGLTDTPLSYNGFGNRLVQVNSGETALEFTDLSVDSIVTYSDLDTLSFIRDIGSGTTDFFTIWKDGPNSILEDAPFTRFLESGGFYNPQKGILMSPEVTDNHNTVIQLQNLNASTSYYPAVVMYKTNAGDAITTGHVLGKIGFVGDGATGASTDGLGAEIVVDATGTWNETTGERPTKLQIKLNQTGDTNSQPTAVFEANRDGVKVWGEGVYFIDLTTAGINDTKKVMYNTTTGKLTYKDDIDTNTTYGISSTAGTGGANLRLTGTNPTSTDDVIFKGAGISTVTSPDANTVLITSTEIDGSVTNEGVLGVSAGSATSSVITSNTSGATGVTINASTGLSISEVTSANGGSITLTNTAPDTYAAVTKGNLTESVTGLQFNATRQVIGGAADLSLTSGYEIPTTTSINQWNTAFGWGNHAGLYLPLTGGTMANTNLVTNMNAQLFGGQYATNFIQGLDGISYENLDNYTDNGFRTVGYVGQSRVLLSFNVGGSVGTVQTEYGYDNILRWRNKTDNNTWTGWRTIYHTGNFIAGTHYQEPLTNPITGTGTTNYLPKWTGLTTQGNSQIYDNGTNVGIGTTSPLDKLQITDGRLRFLESGQRQYSIGVPPSTSAFSIKDESVGITRLYMDGDGKFSIGGMDPQTHLDVRGTVRTTENILIGAYNTLMFPNTQWGASSESTGMVVIELPGGISNYGMIHAVIDIYEYDSSNSPVTITVGGHNWNGGWYNIGANQIGNNNKPVRLGFRNGKYVIAIGTATSTWQYGSVVLRKIHNGTYYGGNIPFIQGITISQTTDESFTWVSADLKGVKLPLNTTIGNNAVYHAGNLTNPITGTGTTNHLPKWTGLGTLGNSLLVSVYEDIRATSDGSTNVWSLSRQDGITGVPTLAITGYQGIGFNGGVMEGFPTSYQMYINNVGNVGIGMTNIPATLSVGTSGTVRSMIAYFSETGFVNGSHYGLSLYSDPSKGTFPFYFYNNYVVNTTPVLSMDRVSNSVGIGVEQPTQKLDVDGNARFRAIGTTTTSTILGVTSDGTLTTNVSITGGATWKGGWNASTNTPTLSDATGTNGWWYKVAVAGTQNLGSGSITFAVGDDVIHNGTIWQKYSASITEADPVFVASDVYDWTTTDSTLWRTAYNWGNHAGLYLPLTGGTMANTTLVTNMNAQLFNGQYATNFIQGLTSGAEASIDNYTDNGFRAVSYTGYSRTLLSFSAGGSPGPIQMEFNYDGLFRWRNKTDNATWTGWRNIFHSGNFTDNSTNWNAAYNDKINSAAFSGTTTKTLTLTQQDGGTVTANFTDDNTTYTGSAGVQLVGNDFRMNIGSLNTGAISASTHYIPWYQTTGAHWRTSLAELQAVAGYNAGKLQGYAISATAPTIGQAIVFDGTNYAPTTLPTATNYWTQASGALYPATITDEVRIGSSTDLGSQKLQIDGPSVFRLRNVNTSQNIDFITAGTGTQPYFRFEHDGNGGLRLASYDGSVGWNEVMRIMVTSSTPIFQSGIILSKITVPATAGAIKYDSGFGAIHDGTSWGSIAVTNKNNNFGIGQSISSSGAETMISILNTNAGSTGISVRAGGTSTDILRLRNSSGTDRFRVTGGGEVRVSELTAHPTLPASTYAYYSISGVPYFKRGADPEVNLASGGGGVTTYQALTDAQDYSAGTANYYLRVNSTGTGIVLSSATVSAHSILAHSDVSYGTIANNDLIRYSTTLGGWVVNSPDMANLVDKTSTQTIAGVKTFSNKPVFPSSNSSWASINLSPGTNPTSPSAGDIWTTTTGVYSWINGSLRRLDEISEVPYVGATNSSYTLNLATHVNARSTTNTNITITISNPSEGKTGNIEVYHTPTAPATVTVTFSVPTNYNLFIADNIHNTTTYTYRKSVKSRTTGTFAVYSYYVSDNRIYINGTQFYD